MKNNDYSVPLQAWHILSKLFKQDDISFKSGYDKVIAYKGIILGGTTHLLLYKFNFNQFAQPRFANTMLRLKLVCR